MPIYEFQCWKCSREFPVFFRSANKEEPVACPGCGSDRVFRLLSTFGLKSGSGFKSSSSGSSGCSTCSGGSCDTCS